MLAVVKTPHIRIHIKGRIPSRLITVLKKEYGDDVRLIEDQEDQFVDVFKTGWYKRAKERLTPGTNLRIYRQNLKMTQDTLGGLLGDLPRQYVSNMENSIRPISKKVAIKLAKIFDTSVDKFIG